MSAWELKRLMTGAPPMAVHYLKLANAHNERAAHKILARLNKTERQKP